MPSLESPFGKFTAQELIMKSLSIALALVVAALLAAPASLLAQETKTARGTAAVVADDSLTLKMPDHEMKFAVDPKTTVEVVGGGTRTRQAQRSGQPGPKLTALLKTGQPVTVSYVESNGVMRATRIRAVSSVGAAATTGDASGGTKSANGTVKSIAGTSMTITGSGGTGATFTQTFTIDGTTKVIGKGAGTAAAAAGGKIVVTDLVSNGDTVSVTYHPMGNSLHAAEIRVTAKAAK
jgi:hypothetical protein